ncbi:hypothetical protein CR513_10838, partial [Mucuna pruriens]
MTVQNSYKIYAESIQTTPSTKSMKNYGDKGACTNYGKYDNETMIVFKLLDIQIGGTQEKNGRGTGYENHNTYNKGTVINSLHPLRNLMISNQETFGCLIHELQIPNGRNTIANKDETINLDKGLTRVMLFDKLCVIQDLISRTVIGLGEQQNVVYHFRAVTFVKACKTSGHRRLGHPSSQIVTLLPNIPAVKKDKHEQNKANKPFDLIHCDIWGSYHVCSSCDDFSRAMWIYLLAEKSEVESTVEKFCTMMATQFNRKVKIVRSDNGTELRNGRVERKHRHILNVARALHFQANLPIEFWDECVLIVVYLINCTPSIIHKGKTPYEILFGQTPIYSYIWIFGEYFESRDVVFCENKFPFLTNASNAQDNSNHCMQVL